MRQRLKLDFPKHCNPKMALTSAGAVRIDRKHAPYHIDIHNARSYGYTYIYTHDHNDFYLKRTDENLPMQMSDSTTIYQITNNNFLSMSKNFEIKSIVRNQWFEQSLALGIGDMFWQMSSFLITGKPTLLHDASYLFPLLIGPITGVINYGLQTHSFTTRQDRPMTEYERSELKKDSAALCQEMSMGMLSWEAGLYLTISILNGSPQNKFIFLSGILAGLSQAIGVTATCLISEINRHGKIVRPKTAIVKSSFGCFVAGSAWYYLSAINYAPSLTGLKRNILNAFVGGVVTLGVITTIYGLVKPKQSIRSLMFCKRGCGGNREDQHNYRSSGLSTF